MRPECTRGVDRPLRQRERGYAMVALLVAMSVMAILMTAAMPAWETAARREKEAELVFRGEQYARAIGLFQQKYGNTSPPSIDVLVRERFLRKKYKDPITGDDFALITPGTVVAGRELPAALPGRGGAQTGARSGQSSSAFGSRSGATSSSTSTFSQRSTRMDGNEPGSGGSRGGLSATRTSTGRTAGASGGIMGVMSKSTEKSLRVYKGSDHYNEWLFMGTQASGRVGGPNGASAPGAPAGRGQPAPGRGGAPTSRGGRGSGFATPAMRGRGFGQ